MDSTGEAQPSGQMVNGNSYGPCQLSMMVFYLSFLVSQGYAPAVSTRSTGIVSERCLPFCFCVFFIEVLLRATFCKMASLRRDKQRVELYTVNELKRFLRDLGQLLPGTKA